MPDIFISYARSTAKEAQQIADALRALGYGVWRDDELPAHRAYVDVIEERLSDAKAVVVVWSVDAVKSQWVRSEAEVGRAAGTLVQLSIDGTSPHMPFSQIQCADLAGWSGQPDAPGWLKVLASVAELAGPPGEALKIPSIPVQPAGPETHGGAHGTPPVSRESRAWFRHRRRWLIVVSGLAVVAAAALAWVWIGHQPPPPNSIRIDRVQTSPGDAQAGLFADGLAGNLALMAQGGQSGLRFYEPGPQAVNASPKFTVDGRARSVAGRLNATLELHLASDGSIIWSAAFDQPLADAADMPRQAALELADVLTCAMQNGDRETEDIEVLELFLSACEKSHSGGDPGSVRDLLRKVVARAPNFARAWAKLSYVDANAILSDRNSPDAYGADRKATEQEASRALALDSRQALAWVARGIAAERLDEWPRRDANFARALAIEPDLPEALDEHAEAFGEIGRGRDALATFRHAVIADPLVPELWEALADNEAYQGDLAGAYATLDEAEKRWPSVAEVNVTRLYLAARIGDPATAQRLLNDPTQRAHLSSIQAESLRLLIAARADPTKGDPAAAFFIGHAGKDLNLHAAVQGLVGVGRVDQAFDLIEKNIATFASQRELLDGFFRSFMAKFLASPRFMPLAARLGLVAVWRQTGLWPDFCTAPDAPYDCKARAALVDRH